MGQKVLVPPQPCPKPPAVFLSPPCPLVISLIPFLFLSQGGCQQGLGKELSLSSLELAIFTSAWVLVLSSSPFLPLQMCLLLELLPPNSQVPWELLLKERKKKKASAQGWASPGSWGLVPGSPLPAMPTSPWAQNKPKPSLYVDDALL